MSAEEIGHFRSCQQADTHRSEPMSAPSGDGREYRTNSHKVGTKRAIVNNASVTAARNIDLLLALLSVSVNGNN